MTKPSKKLLRPMLLNAISEFSGLSKTDSEQALKAVVKAIQLSLVDEKSVSITGLGTFRIFHRPEKTGRHPRSGSPMEISAAKVPRFKASKKLKDAVA